MIFWIVLLAGCQTPPPPRGGMAAQSLLPGNPEGARQALQQPDAPEGVSRQELVDREVEHRPDGVVVIRERNATTSLGGSQDWAHIVREYGRIDLLRGLLLGAGLSLGAVVAWSRDWPVLGVILGAGAGASVLFAWWAGVVALLAAGALYFGWTASGAAARAALTGGPLR